MARKKMFVSHDKAKRDLGFDPAEVDGALRRAVEWFRRCRACPTGS
jgi:dihydroflavonol-4-reductase